MRSKILAGIAGALLLSAVPCSAEVIDFSDVLLGNFIVVFPNPPNPPSPFQSQGFTFAPTPASPVDLVDAANDPNSLRTPVDGHSVFVVQVQFGLGGGGSFAPTAGGTFGLTSLDAVWWRDFAPDFTEDFTITGHFDDGTTQSVNGVLNPGTFDPLVLNWTGLDSVSFTASGGFGWFALGNINVQTDAPATVPDGGSGLLLALAAALAICCRTRRHWA